MMEVEMGIGRKEESKDTWLLICSFIVACRGKGLKINTVKNKVMAGGEEELEYEFCIDKIYLKHILEFKYLRYVLDESGTDEAV